MAYLANVKKDALVYLKDLSSQLSTEKEDQQDPEFIHKALELIQSIIATLEPMETKSRKRIVPYLDLILSTGRQVAQIVSLQMLFDAVFKVSQEIESLFDGSVPDDIKRYYCDLKDLLTEALEKIKEIQASCDKIMDKAIKACGRNHCNSKTFRRELKAYLLKTSADDIRSCEETVRNARVAIEKLQEEATKEAFKHGFDFAATKAVEMVQAGVSSGFYGVLKVIGTTAASYFTKPKGDGMACYDIANKLQDYTNDWENAVNNKGNKYLEISTRLQDCLNRMVDHEKGEEVINRSRRGCLFACCIRESEE